MRDAGIGGRLLRAIIGLIFGTSVTIGVRRGVDTNRVPLGVGLLSGLLEGAVLSPALFAFVTNSLIAALRASGLGVRIDGVHVPAVMLMDDLAILAYRREARGTPTASRKRRSDGRRALACAGFSRAVEI